MRILVRQNQISSRVAPIHDMPGSGIISAAGVFMQMHNILEDGLPHAELPLALCQVRGNVRVLTLIDGPTT